MVIIAIEEWGMKVAEKKDISWNIYWNEYTANSYIYGSEITFHSKNHIEYINKLMPPGTIINRWYSLTNYQLQKIEPSLPIIDGEIKYKVIANINSERDNELLLKFIFYDRYKEEVGSIVINDLSGEFKCPLKTYSYEMQLISGGVSRFDFHWITIQEILDEEK